MRIEDKKLASISGGDNLSGTILNYFSTALTTVYNIGKSFGGAIRRIATRNVCPI